MAATGGGSGGAGGSDGAGGSGGAPANLAAAMRHMLPVDEEDYDCSIELVLQEAAAAAAAASEAVEERPAKRAKVPPFATCRASSVALKQHSEVFRCWIKGWTSKRKKNQKQILRIECEDEEEAAAFRQLLEYVHSAGRALPEGPVSILRLLAVARKHGVEACVDACLQLLLAQVDQLPLQPCLRLLPLLETGVSPKEDVQAQADQLMQRGSERLCALLKDEAAVVASDAELPLQLAAFFGRWHSMLNCALRRKAWLALPFELLSAMFQDRHVQADTEATVLAAFAYWADSNIAAGPLAPEDRQRIAAVCSRIRFPAIPPDVLCNYHLAFKWLQQYDSNKELLLRALATAADVQQAALWQSKATDPAATGDATDADALLADCHLWWTPRTPALVCDTDKAKFDFQIVRPSGTALAFSDNAFWRGYWWRIVIECSSDLVAFFAIPTCSTRFRDCSNGRINRCLYSVKVAFAVKLHPTIAAVSRSGTEPFMPACIRGWGARRVEDGSGGKLTWERFWADDSPFLRSGKVQAQLQLQVPPS